MKKLLATAGLAGLLFAGAGSALAAPPTGNKVTCSGPGCTQLSPNRVHLNVDGAAYLPNQGGTGTLLTDLTKLSFTYSGSGAEGGSPRFSIAVDADGADLSSADDFYIFADIVGCNDDSTTAGVVDVAGDSTCAITAPDGTFPNLAAYASAHPTYTLGYNYTFVIADSGTPSYDIWNVQIATKSRGGKA